MIILLNIYKIILNIVYFFIKLIPTSKQITLISRQSNDLSLDFKLLSNSLKKELTDYKIVVLCKKIGPGLLNKIKYQLYMFKMMVNISKSKVVILDSYCIPISILKHKKSLKVIQMWHAIGLLKKAGYSIIGKEEGNNYKVAKTLCMHKNYDYALASSKNCIKAMSEVFSCNPDIIKVIPLPRVDLLLDTSIKTQKIEEISNKYPKIKDKINILYAPTFRKDETLMQTYLDKLINSINYDKYNLIVSLHPLSKLKINNSNVLVIKDYSTFDLLFISDHVISDYSSIIYEAGILEKPLYFYTFDLDSYDIKRGFFIDYMKEIPGIITDDAKKIIKEIDGGNYNYNNEKKFINKYVDLSNKDNTKKLVNLIKKEL